jgi:drug/metabolite transporter (DMT)-like permease
MLAAATATGALFGGDDDDGERQQQEQSSSSWVRAGAEIGLYNFLGTACQVTGVHATTATKAAFLGQATTALTPALAALGGLKVTAVQWGACLAAVAGSALIAGDEVASSSSSSSASDAAAAVAADATSAAAPTLSGGEPLVLLACVFYALSTVRMAVHAPKHGAVRIATAKTTALALLSLVWAFGAAVAGGGGGGGGGDAGEGLNSGLASLSFLALPPALAGSAVALTALAFSALGPGALATWLQASGQRTVPAAEAQVIFSLTPVWTALLSMGAAAVGVVGASAAESAMGGGAWAGSALVLAASLAVALEGRRGGGEDGIEEQ